MILKEVIDKGIKEEGERMVPAFHKGNLVYGEHISRYESVKDILKDKVVLDIASGSGYGTYVLSEKAKKIYGVDVDADAVKYAKKNYPRKNIEYLLGDAEKIPLEDNSIDVVITFETIEHIKDYKKFLDEIKRVLRPDGFAVISTPNDPEFPEGNHFHLHEFEEKELSELIKQYFKTHKFYYQYTWISAGIIAPEKTEKESSFTIAASNLAPVPKNKAIYFMVVCSDESILDLVVDEGIYLSQHYSARHINEDDTAKKNYVEYLEGEVRSLSIPNDKTRAVYQKEIDEYIREVAAVKDSKSWKIINKMHGAISKLKKK